MDWVEAHDMTSVEFEQKNSEIGNRLAHVAGYCVGDIGTRTGQRATPTNGPPQKLRHVF